ncbi:MAG: hypothetical protein JW715_06005 [Sedimentisphaerales bacterium]|nr:hypothetical protein [Sedimentisphaerales bacterium]
MKWRAFTLIELLVILSIIALVITILIPSLRYSKENAKAVLCGSNIRQLTMSLTLYDSENGTFPYSIDMNPVTPPAGGYAGNIMYDRAGWWWFQYIIDYSKHDFDSIMWCPSRRIKKIEIKYNELCGNYGVNQSVCKMSDSVEKRVEFIGKPLSAGGISNPGQTLLILDSGYSMINWWHATDKPPEPLGDLIENNAYVPGLWVNKDRDLWPGFEDDAVYGRHPGRKVNIGYGDGHLARIKADDLYVEKTGDTYRFKQPLWLPK